MRLKLIILVLMLTLAGAVSAQTSTPTPGCTGGIDIGNLNIGGQCTSNTINSDTKSDLYRNMATAAANVNALPEQIRGSGTTGNNVVPSTAGATQIFGYVKWLLSGNTAQELLGRSLAPFGVNLAIILILVIALTGVYFLVNFAVLIIKAIIWIINQILKLIPFW